MAHSRTGAPLRAIAVLALGLAGAGASSGASRSPGTPASPSSVWKPPPGEMAESSPAARPAGVSPAVAEWLRSGRKATLAELVDYALRTSPKTRESWEAARSAAAALGSERGAYYPQVDLEVPASRTRGATAGGQLSYESTSIAPSVGFQYLLFDSGGRKATVEEARQELLASNWAHNTAIQDLVLEVERAYFLYVDGKALLRAEEAIRKDALANLDAAEERHRAGVATIADVLQAKTALSQAELQIVTTQGQIDTTRGGLAIAIGLPPEVPLDAEDPPETLPVQMVAGDVMHLIERAVAERPDLAEAFARVRKAESHVRAVQAEGRPAFSLDGSVGDIYYPSSDARQETYALSLLFRLPLFTGYSHRWNVERARADAAKERAAWEGLRQEAVNEVWTAWNVLKTSVQRVRTIADLLESAKQSYDVALGRYRAGVGSILDLLAAQAALEDARSQEVRSRTVWFLALAELAHSTGRLLPGMATPPGADLLQKGEPGKP